MVNDIVCYLHENVPRYVDIMSRAMIFDALGNRMTTHYQLDQYRRQLDKKSVGTEFNIYWGLLTPSERLATYRPLKEQTYENSVLLYNYLVILGETE